MNEDLYQDRAGEWRWRLVADNGKIVGASTEGYKHREDCVANFRMVTTHVWAINPSSWLLVCGLVLGTFFIGLLVGSTIPF